MSKPNLFGFNPNQIELKNINQFELTKINTNFRSIYFIKSELNLKNSIHNQ